MNISKGEIDNIKMINDTVDEHYEIIIEQSHTDLIRDTNDTTENLLIETEDIREEWINVTEEEIDNIEMVTDTVNAHNEIIIVWSNIEFKSTLKRFLKM